MNESVWTPVERPGYFGKHREKRYHEWNQKYGKENWRIVWKIGDAYVDFLGTCRLYEDAYYAFLAANRDVLEQLIKEACEIYDDEPSNLQSRFNYLKQETQRTHIQDIAIRRCVIRFGLWFCGRKLIRIRQEKGNHSISITLSPGRVPFHKVELIEKPELIGWWLPGTVESFYQSNKYLQVKKDGD